MKTIVTKDSLQNMLNNPNKDYVGKVVGKALVVLYNNQTFDEQISESTNKLNNTGFAGCDAKWGTTLAKYYIKHGYLTENQTKKWLQPTKTGYAKICKYHRQLNEAANKKLA